MIELLESHETNELSTALAKAQSEMPIAEKSSSNPFFKSKYADLQSIVEISRPCLTKHGLSVTQQIATIDEGHPYLITKLRHSSGQWIMSKLRMVPAKNDVQSLSSCATYLKRMCYASLVGVVTGEVDDDGESAVAPTRNNGYDHTQTQIYKIVEFIDQEQIEQLKLELLDHPETAKSVYDGMKRMYGSETFTKIPKADFWKTLSRIQTLKSEEKRK